MGVGVAVVWGLCFVLIQATLPDPAPLLLAALRSLVGGGVLVALVVLRTVRRRLAAGTQDRPQARRSGLPPWPALLALAVLNSTLAFGAMYLAAGRAEAAVSSILTGGQPVVLAAAGWLVFRERLATPTVAGLAVALAGIVLIATAGSGETRPDGVALSLLAALAPAGGTILMRRLGGGIDLVATTGVQFVLGGALLLVASLATEPWDGLRLSTSLLFDLLTLGVLGTGVAYVAWFWLLPRLPLAHLGAILYLVPITGVVVAIAAGDRPTAVELMGMVVVLAGMALVVVDAGPTGDLAGPDQPVR